MFRDMRRTKQLLPAEEAEDILRQASAGVLAVSGDNGYPYAVPLSYAYADDKLYFHLATSGHKLDGIRRNEKVSFCVIAQDEVVPERFATDYRSVIAFGRAHASWPKMRSSGMRSNSWRANTRPGSSRKAPRKSRRTGTGRWSWRLRSSISRGKRGWG